jgi:hypothetical protein
MGNSPHDCSGGARSRRCGQAMLMPRGDGDGNWRESREMEVTDRERCRRGKRLTHAASPAKRVSSMKKVVSGGPANRTALQEPCRPFGYNPVELSRFAGGGPLWYFNVLAGSLAEGVSPPIASPETLPPWFQLPDAGSSVALDNPISTAFTGFFKLCTGILCSASHDGCFCETKVDRFLHSRL